MKQLLFSLLILSFAQNGISPGNPKTVEIRSGEWPIVMQQTIGRSDTLYSVQFRDVQVLSGTVMDTLSFSNTTQLKYFETALTALKSGHNGDAARFKDYSIIRADKKFEGTWYMLKLKYSLTNFKQSEADVMVNTIRKLKFE